MLHVLFFTYWARSLSRENRLFAAACASVRPSALLSACTSAASTGRISVKFGAGDFYGYLSIECKFG